MMNPQILIDGVEHGVRGMIVIFDNRRMAAITGLQLAQYGAEFRTNDGVAVDYVRLAGAVSGVLALSRRRHAPTTLRAALKAAHAHDGLSVVHVPVYCGPTRTRRPRRLGRSGTSATGARTCSATWIEQDL